MNTLTELTVLRREQIRFVFQAVNLVPTFTAIENIMLPSALTAQRPGGAGPAAVLVGEGLPPGGCAATWVFVPSRP
jgi:ABC-type lipoprotein export system ATPase subunit